MMYNRKMVAKGVPLPHSTEFDHTPRYHKRFGAKEVPILPFADLLLAPPNGGNNDNNRGNNKIV